jgi:hypothetical protein
LVDGHKQPMKSTICIAEDRLVCEPALRLLLLSLDLHNPGKTISLFYPVASEEFLQWVRRFAQVRVQTDRLRHGFEWDVKPQAMMLLLEQGFDEAIWIDSDIVVTGDVSRVFGDLRSDCMVATEDGLGDDRNDQNALRTRLWGLPVGRVLPFGLNSGVLRITKHHHRLMERWWELLQSEDYRAVQRREWAERPLHMMGDQDVLTALLCSSEFSDLPLFILRRGKHILQFNGVYGYTVAERTRNLFGDGPIFIHSFAGKPWSHQWKSGSLREYIKNVYLDLSPYTSEAREFKTEIGSNSEWIEPHYRLSRALRLLGLGRRELVGLPVAVLMDMIRAAKGQSGSTRNRSWR